MRRDAESEGVHRVRRTSKDVSPEGETSRSSTVRGANLSLTRENAPKEGILPDRFVCLGIWAAVDYGIGLGEYRSLVWMIYGGR